MERGLIRGFSESETQRIQRHLEKLFPHLEQGRFTIVGGLAIRYHLIERGINYPNRPFNDLDIIASVLLSFPLLQWRKSRKYWDILNKRKPRTCRGFQFCFLEKN